MATVRIRNGTSVFLCERMEQMYSKKNSIVLCWVFFIKVRRTPYESFFLLSTDFFLFLVISSVMCMCVNMFLRMCSIIAYVRLKF